MTEANLELRVIRKEGVPPGECWISVEEAPFPVAVPPAEVKPRVRVEPGSPEDLARHMEWLYGENGVYHENAGTPCLCDHGYTSSGRLHGVSMGKNWHRLTTNPECVHHGKDSK